LNGHQGDIRTVLGDLQTVITSLATNRASIDSALTGLTQLSQELAQGSAAISNGIDTIGPAVGVLADDNADFSRLLSSTDQLSTIASSVVKASGQAGVTDIKEIDGVLNELVRVEQDIGPTLANFSRFESLTPKIAPGNYLQLSLTGNAIVNPAPVLGANSPSPAAGTSAPATSNGTAITGLLGAGLP
jgi:phospholipid/cholesterol/gamma-HCH transport system substrate-binding protein